MIDPLPILTFALAALLAGLALALAALWLRHQTLCARIRRMADVVPEDGQGSTGPKAGVWSDILRLEQAIAAMVARLDAQEATLDQAFEIAGLGTWSILPDLGSVRASPHIRKVMGFSAEEDIVKLDAFRDRIVPKDRAAFVAALERAAKERQTTEVEFRAIDAAGEARIFWARTGPGGAVPHDSNRGISGIIQDITDLRRKKTALARSSRLARLAGEAARVGGWRFELGSRMLVGTHETAKILALDGDCVASIDDTMDRLVQGEDRARMERSFWACVGAGTGFDEIARFTKADGEVTWLRVIGEAERDASGKIIATHGAMQDVSELINARTAANDVRVLLQTILDDLSDGFVIHDRDGTIRYINRRAHSILGVPDLDLMGGNVWQDPPWVGGSSLECMISEALETGESRSLEGEIASPDRWVNVMVHPTPAGIAIYLNDVTAEREARTRLRLLDAAMRRVSDVVLITDARSLDWPGPSVVFVNEAFVSMTGYSKDDILGATPRILQGPDTEQEKLKEIRDALNANEPVRTELTNYRKDGSRFIAEIDINPLFDANGACTHYVAVQRDTTERRKNEEHLRAREERLRLASKASDDINLGLGHADRDHLEQRKLSTDLWRHFPIACRHHRGGAIGAGSGQQCRENP